MRIWLKNRFISLKEIKKYEKKIAKLKIKLSLFEILTIIYILAALLYFCLSFPLARIVDRFERNQKVWQ